MAMQLPRENRFPCRNSRSGMVLAGVLFFAFAVSIGLLMLVQTNVTIGWQNRNAVRQLQAYYIAQSGLQHMLLKLRLLPREAYEMMKDSSGPQDFSRDVSSDNDPRLAFQELSAQEADRYSLFDEASCPDVKSPYPGTYSVERLAPAKSHLNLRFGQDTYELQIMAEVSAPPRAMMNLEEEVFLSRFTGGIGGGP